MIRIVIALSLVPVLLTSARSATGWDGSAEYRGRHYLFVTDVEPDLARDLVTMLDAQHGRLRAIFGRAPKSKGPLVVRLFANKADYESLVGGSGGGMYTYRDSIANVWIQPHLYWTRHLMLHETTHQWMHLAFARNRDLIPWWLDEGFAEYCAFHVWDGTTLRTELHDVITLMDYPAKAKAITAPEDWSVETTFAGGVSGDRAEAWALIHWLMNGPRRKKLLKLLAEVPRKVHVENRAKVEKTARDLFRRIVSPRLDDVTDGVRAHAASLDRTWSILTIAWDRRGEVIEGNAKTTGVLRFVKESLGPTAEVSFRYRVLGGAKGWVGLAHGIRDLRHFDVVTLKSPREALWNGLRKTGWTRHGTAGRAGPRDADWHDVTVRFGARAVEVIVDGRSLGSMRRREAEPLGTVGLFIDAARADFRDFRVKR